MQLDMREHRDQLESARRELEIRLWVQLHHLELMKSHGRSVARSIGRSQADGEPRALPHTW